MSAASFPHCICKRKLLAAFLCQTLPAFLYEGELAFSFKFFCYEKNENIVVPAIIILDWMLVETSDKKFEKFADHHAIY